MTASSTTRALREELRADVTAQLGDIEGAGFLARLDRVGPDLSEALSAVYADLADVPTLVADVVRDALATATARPQPLRVLDRVRAVDQQWFLAQDIIGYVCYADRFASDLNGVRARLDYLGELGVRYLHLMPLLKPRPGENDGGYAVQDYDAVDPRLGTMADLEALATAAHERDLALCIDLVLNHTAREHAWAQAALAGDPHFRAFYRFFPDRSGPDAYEHSLPEVFPGLAPGSFSYLPESQEWVWTTFNEFQWDLDWSNPDVFRAMLTVLFTLANRGVDVVRLDAAPFLWKRLGTDSQNQPEAHRLLQALRAATALAAPGLLLKAEAIVGPDQLVPYLGGHELYRPECDLAYDNQLMVMLWSALATRDVRLAEQAMSRRPAIPRGTGWVSYVRCHDDIGWAVSDQDAWSVGLDPFSHRQFLAAFYAGRHPGSFASGLDFQSNSATGDARTSGTAASLCGLDVALAGGSATQVDAGLDRLVLLHSVIYSFGGIPLVYMGDELALRNDTSWSQTAEHRDDNRWAHRPPMDWAAAARRTEPGALEARVFTALQALGVARRSTASLRSDADVRVLSSDNPHVLAYLRHHPRAAPVLALACFSDDHASVDAALLAEAGIADPVLLHASTGRLDLLDGRIHLPAWGFSWISGR